MDQLYYMFQGQESFSNLKKKLKHHKAKKTKTFTKAAIARAHRVGRRRVLCLDICANLLRQHVRGGTGRALGQVARGARRERVRGRLAEDRVDHFGRVGAGSRGF